MPEPKAPTKWEQFAAKRGIKPKTREQRRMKSQKYNEETGQWEKTWGYNKDGRIDRKEKGMVQQDVCNPLESFSSCSSYSLRGHSGLLMTRVCLGASRVPEPSASKNNY